ncbi:uracil-DNA glycosylase [Limnohabitans sp. 63ED37-2]|uniref:uracil-DNA glycosylase n=1 Tax=Limnohabitans sp. 63ED37-2 TaxID=1678128 RepID=UPI0007062F8D|nr:uracil-DNA glycosylase [Limnohabitans sp. 63ED37-2]ALK87404.1 Uracil DNA glycosylase superfamily protein [Limnohabitans sp. 63ED37-2]
MSDPTRFDLDDRQRAMLAEMGVRVWWPQRSDAEPHAVVEVVPARATDTAVPAPGEYVAASPSLPAAPRASVPVQAPATRPATREPLALAPAPVQAKDPVLAPLPEGLPSMGWLELQTAVQSCQSCGLGAARQTPILGSGQGTAPWMVVGDLPSDTDEPSGQPFTGPEGVLLDNMLKAVGVRRQGSAHNANADANALADLPEACLTHAVKCRPQNGRNPETSELATCAAYLSRQVTLVQPRVILAMGRFAIQSLLGSTEPMGKLRGRLHDFQGVPVVVTYPPSSLLRNPADKAKAWADLVLALSVTQG